MTLCNAIIEMLGYSLNSVYLCRSDYFLPAVWTYCKFLNTGFTHPRMSTRKQEVVSNIIKT
jgi:hypothetical protein